MLAAKQQAGSNNAKKTAMKRHAAIENSQGGHGVGEVIAGVIKQHISQSAPDDDPENQPGDEVIQVRFAESRFILRPKLGSAQGTAHDPRGKQNASDIGQSVPAQGKFKPTKAKIRACQ